MIGGEAVIMAMVAAIPMIPLLEEKEKMVIVIVDE